MKKIKIVAYLLRIVGFIVLLFPLITFRGCLNSKLEKEKTKLDSLVQTDNMFLKTTMNDKIKDSIKLVINGRKERINKIVNTDSSYNWNTYYGFNIPLGRLEFGSTESDIASTELILIDLIILFSFIGLILILIRKFRKYKYLRLTSVLNILFIIAVIIIAMLNHKFVRLEISIWIVLIINILAALVERKFLITKNILLESN